MKERKEKSSKQSSKTVNKGFTLIELLVVVLIIGILAAIALPKYQLAVDKARFARIMDFTKAVVEARGRALMINYETTPNFDKFDIDIPPNCTLKKNNVGVISCDNNIWGCYINGSGGQYIRCSDFKINATYYYTISSGDIMDMRGYCLAHTLDENDRPNRLCKNITGAETPVNKSISLFNNTGLSVSVKAYSF